MQYLMRFFGRFPLGLKPNSASLFAQTGAIAERFGKRLDNPAGP
jgi:hypothetical protein